MLVTTLFYGQWVQVPNTLGGSVNDMYCISDNVVFAGGNNGYLAKTTDGGITWNTKTSGTTSNIVKVQFANANVGYVLLQDKTLIKTLDGGESWSTAIFSTILDISIVSPTIIYVTNINGHLLKSLDGGINFTTINNTNLYKNIQFVSENIGFGGNNPLERTTDGGLTWTSIGDCDSRIQDFGFENGLFHFVNENVGYKLMTNQAYKTNNGGSSYELLTTIDHYVGKIFATTENVLWLITVLGPINGQTDYTTRLETVGNSVTRNDVSFPIFRCITFLSPTVGYATDGVYAYKNITGSILGTVFNIDKQQPQIYFNSPRKTIEIKITDNLLSQSNIISIEDSLGKKIFTSTYSDLVDISIDSSTFSSGIYFVTVFAEKSKYTQKLIIN